MEILGAVVVDGEAAGGRGGHGVVGGLEPVHADCPVRQGAACGEQHVDGPDPLGRGGESRVYLCAYGAGGLGGKHLHASSHERGDDGDGEEHDSQSAYPLCERAPEQDGVGQTLHVVEYGGAGGGEARHGFEEGVGDVGDAAVEEKGKHAEEGEDDPRGGDHQIGVAPAERVLGIASGKEQEEGATRREQHRQQEGEVVVFLIPEGYCCAQSHEEGFDEQQRTDDF